MDYETKMYIVSLLMNEYNPSDGSMIRLDKVEHYIREDLNRRSRRVMVVLKPLKVILCLLHHWKCS